MRVTLDCVSVNVRISEGKVPAIFLHGNGESSSLFKDVPKYLSPQFKVIAPDTRGHGKSTYAPLSYDYFAEDVKGIADALGLNKPVLVGFSDGAITALKALIEYPGFFGGAVLAGANFAPGGLKRKVRALFKATYFLTRSERVRLMLDEPVFDEKDIAAIDAPVLILAGEKDMVELSHTEKLASLIKGSELKILKGESHSSYVADNRKFVGEISGFLMSVGGKNE